MRSVATLKCLGPPKLRFVLTKRLAEHTSLRVGGQARTWVEAPSADELVAAVAQADAAGEPVLIVGGGSNLVVSDAGFPGVVVHVASTGITTREALCDTDLAACGGVLVDVQAGESWDAFVAWSVDHELTGIEALSGIPGAVGSTPIQNVGAYGQEVAQTLWNVRTWDRQERRYRTFANAECGFGYRTSRFKQEPGRYIIVSVTFQLRQGDTSEPVRYSQLADRLGVGVGQRAPLRATREAVLALRRGKGMVLDPDDHDTWSAGSFFTNPVIDAALAKRLPQDAPRYPAEGDRVKTSAAWLIEQAGFTRGYGEGPAGVSTKHSLALTNRGEATAADVVALAREVRDGVQQRFGIALVPEPVFVGVSLD